MCSMDLNDKNKSTSHAISIVMLTYNDYKKTKRCIKSILDILSNEIFYELIILDNNSNFRTRNYIKSLSSIEKIKIILSNTNLGIARGRKKLFNEAKADVIASLDSDVIVHDITFFNKALTILDRDIHVGICGSSGYYVSFIKNDLCLEKCEQEGYADCISGCCQIFWKYLLAYVEIDENYSPFWCEDTDFCFQILQQKKLAYYIPGEYGLQHDYRSKKLLKNDPEKEKKQNYLVNKWKGKLSFLKSAKQENSLVDSILPKIWIFHLDNAQVNMVPFIEAMNFADYCILTKDNIYDYLPELKKDPGKSIQYIQLLLLFKYGGLCIDYHYFHLNNIFKPLFNKLSAQKIDLILFKRSGMIQNDIIIGKRGSSMIHKCLLFKNIKHYSELIDIFGSKCEIAADLIGDINDYPNGNYQLIKMNDHANKNEITAFIDKYCSKVSKYYKSLLFLFDLPENAINLSIKKIGDHYYGIARHESNLNDPLNSLTKNVLYIFSDSFNVLNCYDLSLIISDHQVITRNRKKLSEIDFIVEDIRFIENTGLKNNKIWVYGHAMVDYENNYATKIAILELNVEKHTLTFLRFLSINPEVTIEKNWIIYYRKNHFYIIYKIDPLEIYRCYADMRTIKLYYKHDYQILSNYFKEKHNVEHEALHLCTMVDYDQQYQLIVFRLYTFNQHYEKQMKRIYYSFGVLMDKNTGRLDYLIPTDIFASFSHNIIINNATIRTGTHIYFFCGFNDIQSGYIKLALNDIASRLVPIAD